MKTENYLESQRLTELQKRIWDIAKEHGWHDKPISKEHYLGLVMTEVAEAVEADRNGRRAESKEFAELLDKQPKAIDSETNSAIYKSWFEATYKNYIKGSIEEEFADVVIRILDMAQEIHGERINWICNYPCGEVYHEGKSFIENAWCFVRRVLGWGTMNISDSVSFMFDWAQHLDIDLWQHIEWKMKYNEMRPYKHGGKKY